MKSAVVLDGRFRVFEDGTVNKIKNGIETTIIPSVVARKNSKTKYNVISYNENGKEFHEYVHRLVAGAFIPNPFNKPEVNHIDGDKSNNNVSNLEWVTRKENVHHAYETGLINLRANGAPCKACGALTRSKYGFCYDCQRKNLLLKQISTEAKSQKADSIKDKYRDYDVSILTERERQCVSRAKDGKGITEISKEIGVSRQRVFQLLEKAGEKQYNMPRIKDNTDPLTRLLKGYGVNGNNLSVAINSSPATARKKIYEPQRLTLGDLKAIQFKFGIPVNELRERVL